jgi:hypothetical protein
VGYFVTAPLYTGRHTSLQVELRLFLSNKYTSSSVQQEKYHHQPSPLQYFYRNHLLTTKHFKREAGSPGVLASCGDSSPVLHPLREKSVIVFTSRRVKQGATISVHTFTITPLHTVWVAHCISGKALAKQSSIASSSLACSQLLGGRFIPRLAALHKCKLYLSLKRSAE